MCSSIISKIYSFNFLNCIFFSYANLVAGVLVRNNNNSFERRPQTRDESETRGGLLPGNQSIRPHSRTRAGPDNQLAAHLVVILPNGTHYRPFRFLSNLEQESTRCGTHSHSWDLIAWIYGDFSSFVWKSSACRSHLHFFGFEGSTSSATADPTTWSRTRDKISVRSPFLSPVTNVIMIGT